MLALKLSHQGQDDFKILTICFKQKEDGMSSHTLKCGGSSPKNSDEANNKNNKKVDNELAAVNQFRNVHLTQNQVNCNADQLP